MFPFRFVAFLVGSSPTVIRDNSSLGVWQVILPTTLNTWSQASQNLYKFSFLDKETDPESPWSLLHTNNWQVQCSKTWFSMFPKIKGTKDMILSFLESFRSHRLALPHFRLPAPREKALCLLLWSWLNTLRRVAIEGEDLSTPLAMWIIREGNFSIPA